MTNYRNKKLLDLARESPCQMCGIDDQTTVSAHSNQLRDGKGRSIKSDDFRIAYLCHRCHFEIDQGSKLSREERVNQWELAHRNTIGWLFTNGHLTVK
jgi:hypothetical protein